MREVDTDEVQRVFSLCAEPIEKISANYKKTKGVTDFKPVIKLYPVGSTGFVVLFMDTSKETLASILNMEGNMIFTSYWLDNDMLN